MNEGELMTMPCIIADQDACPCCSGVMFINCCHPMIFMDTPAPTPLALMRSRYTAFVLDNTDYIMGTMKLSALDDYHKQTYKIENTVIWQSLEIIKYSKTKPKDKQGTVEFKARYTCKGTSSVLHERSQFRKINGFWYYTSGKHKSS